jgi:CRISPR/Cas system CMR-associated protein Cmr5 small subunit
MREIILIAPKILKNFCKKIKNLLEEKFSSFARKMSILIKKNLLVGHKIIKSILSNLEQP